jgi:hypothetical protein
MIDKQKKKKRKQNSENKSVPERPCPDRGTTPAAAVRRGILATGVLGNNFTPPREEEGWWQVRKEKKEGQTHS